MAFDENEAPPGLRARRGTGTEQDCLHCELAKRITPKDAAMCMATPCLNTQRTDGHNVYYVKRYS